MIKQSKLLLYIGLGFFAIPVLIIGSTVLRIDQSGLSTMLYFFLLGVPSILIGTALVITSAILSRKDAADIPQTGGSRSAKLIKRILVGIIVIMLSTPLLYLIYILTQLFIGE